MGALFIPIVLIELHVARRILQSGRWVTAVVVANLTSTIVGIPMSWGALVLVTMMTLGGLQWLVPSTAESGLGWAILPFYAAWLPPEAELHAWWIPLATLVLLFPFFWMSVWVERKVAAAIGEWPAEAVAAWSWQANLRSYVMLGVVTIAGLCWTLVVALR